MMKRKLLAVVLPLVGCATVVGSGFAAWHFGEIVITNGEIKTSVNVNVTKEVNNASGLLNFDEEVTDDLKGNVLVLDQGGINSDETQGIMIGTADDNETVKNLDVDYTFTLNWGSTGGGEVDLVQIYEAGMKVQLTVTIELTGNLSNYIEMVDHYSLKYGDGVKIAKEFTPKENNSYTAVWEAEKPASKTTTTSWKFNLGFDTDEDLKNEAFKYKEYAAGEDGAFTGKPMYTTEPQKMSDKLTGSAVNINVVAKLVDTKTGA